MTATVRAAVGLVGEGGADSVARRTDRDTVRDTASALSPRKEGPLSSCHAPEQ
ncbi:hypothetical protein ABZ934_00820 [Streptomyces sp. NPDC046557]|uniref:hypothetical protein n=1 Tax=Streptomyces sp. NPDC046557 TaxID=3155372 RepID=UPI0033DB6DD9